MSKRDKLFREAIKEANERNETIKRNTALRAECAEDALKLLEVMHTVNNQAHWGTLFMVDVEAIVAKLKGGETP